MCSFICAVTPFIDFTYVFYEAVFWLISIVIPITLHCSVLKQIYIPVILKLYIRFDWYFKYVCYFCICWSFWTNLVIIFLESRSNFLNEVFPLSFKENSLYTISFWNLMINYDKFEREKWLFKKKLLKYSGTFSST